MYEITEKGTKISEYKGVIRYVKYAGCLELAGVYLSAYYDVFHFEIENDIEVKSKDWQNKRVLLTANNSVAVNEQGIFIAQNGQGNYLDANGNVILNENNEPAKIGENGIIGQYDFLTNLKGFSRNELAQIEIQRADYSKRFDKAINNNDVLAL